MILPKLNDAGGNLSKKWFVYYSVRDPRTDKMERFKDHVGLSHPDESVRRERADKIIQELTVKLKKVTQVSRRRFAQTVRIFPVWTPAQCLPPARCIIAVLQSSALTRSSSKRRALTARILQRSITPAPTMSAHGSPARQRSSAATRIFWTLSTSPVEIVSWRP